MNRISLFFSSLLAVLFLSATSFAAPTTAKVGEAAPNFTLTDENGKEHQLSDFKGKKVVLEWHNHQCPFVVKHYRSGNMQKLQKKYEDVVWLSINSSAPGKQGHVSGEEAQEINKKRNAAPTAVLFDESGEVGKLYDAKTTPHMYVIDEEGKLRYAGAIDSIPSADREDVKQADNYVVNAIDSLKNGEDVDPALTKPYGCSIKYKS